MTTTLTGVDIDIRPGMELPLPDDAAATAARDRLASIDIGVSAPTVTALGMLAEPVVFVAGFQGTAHPRPFLSIRVVLLTGAHSGGVVAGPTPDPRHSVPLQHLATNAGAGMVTLEWQPAAAAIEYEDAITPEQMDLALQAGWAEAERAADEGIELLILAAGGAGASTAAAAVVAATSGSEPTAMLSRVVTPAGLFDDNAWMTRCLAVRDALYRVRHRDGDPRSVLAALGGADIAAATGLVLGAASRRTPIMFDGPVGAAAALLANDFSPQSRRWLLLPDSGRHMAVRIAAEALQLRPWLDLCLDLGEGAAALAALPLLQTALTLATSGEQVEPTPLTRIDSTGGQVFVGVARPVEPAAPEEVVPAQAGAPAAEGESRTTKGKGQAGKRGAKSPTRSVTPPKATPAKAAGAKAGGARATPAKAAPAKTQAASTVDEPAAAPSSSDKGTQPSTVDKHEPGANGAGPTGAPKAVDGLTADEAATPDGEGETVAAGATGTPPRPRKRP
jgi:nicotinate-nucleotide--dimethylbenzimidazole phosphoribosyltransferase